MNDERFEQLMRDAKATYRPVPNVDFDEMWKGIEREMRDERGETRDRTPVIAHRSPLFAHRSSAILAVAATLVIGIALGRASMSLGGAPVPVAPNVVASNVARESQPYDAETSKYLGQTAALLIALPSEVKPGRSDAQFVNHAGELLARTRLLLDSPAASDPDMRNLLEDLELVLAQVVRLQDDKNNSRIELDLISRALEQRDLIPRLRTAVADISAN